MLVYDLFLSLAFLAISKKIHFVVLSLMLRCAASPLSPKMLVGKRSIFFLSLYSVFRIFSR